MFTEKPQVSLLTSICGKYLRAQQASMISSSMIQYSRSFCNTRAQPFSDTWNFPFLSKMFVKTISRAGVNLVWSEGCWGTDKPVKFEDCREILWILVKEILRWVSRNKLVAEREDSLFVQDRQQDRQGQDQHQQQDRHHFLHHCLNGRGPHEFAQPAH